MVEYLRKHGSGAVPAGLTPSQQFFLGYAQSWCAKYRPEALRVRLSTDPHSPPFLRVNGPLRNLNEFQEAFSCGPTAKMVRAEKRCEVW
jgi:endothelin-converting enzyme/putative endopeptidase